MKNGKRRPVNLPHIFLISCHQVSYRQKPANSQKPRPSIAALRNFQQEELSAFLKRNKLSYDALKEKLLRRGYYQALLLVCFDDNCLHIQTSFIHHHSISSFCHRSFSVDALFITTVQVSHEYSYPLRRL